MTDTAPSPERAPFRIENDGQAAWAIRLIASANARLAEVQAWALAEIDRIDTAAAEGTADAVATIARMEGFLADWHARRLTEALGRDLADDTVPTVEEWAALRTKTAKLPTGTVSAKRLPGAYEIVDEAAVIAFLVDAAPDLLVHKIVGKAALTARLAVKDLDQLDPNDPEGRFVPTPTVLLDGEPVPGMRPPRPEVRFTVTPAPPIDPPEGVTLTPPPDFPRKDTA